MVQIDWKIVITGIAAITILESIALLKGINGVVLTTVIAVLALAIGVTLPNPLNK